jgi:uncharacterized protein (UPF0335 family)
MNLTEIKIIERLEAELKCVKQDYLRDLKECAGNGHIKHWIWLNSTIKRLEKDLQEKKQ